MNHIFVTAFFILVSLSSEAVNKFPDWNKEADCSSKDIYQKTVELPGLSRAEVIKRLHPVSLAKSESSQELECGFLVANWSRLPGHFIALYETARIEPSGSGGYSEKYRELSIAIFKSAEGSKSSTLVAQLEKPFRLEKNVEFKKLDLAAYHLSPEQLAFGIRTSRNVTYSGGGGNNSYLILFVVTGERLEPAFETLMSSGALRAGEWNEDGTRDHQEEGSEQSALIDVLPSKSGGHFDLRKWIKGKKKKEAIYRWNGKGYSTNGIDPVKDVNAD